MQNIGFLFVSDCDLMLTTFVVKTIQQLFNYAIEIDLIYLYIEYLLNICKILQKL